MGNTKYSSEILKGREHLGELDTDVRIILNWILKTLATTVAWTHIANDRVQWRAAVNTVRYLWIP
jgi:hypothetical protein